MWQKLAGDSESGSEIGGSGVAIVFNAYSFCQSLYLCDGDHLIFVFQRA
jgi:hypothetical protein